MRDPERLLSRTTGFERALLAAAARERPSRELRTRMRRALGLPLVLSFAGFKAAAVAWAQATVVAVVGAGLVGTASSPPREPTSSPASAPADIRPPPPVVRQAPATEASPVPAPAEEAKAPKRAPTRAPSDDVREEIRLLDHARAALLQHAPARALERLGQYAQRFPRGALRQEATVLRIEALGEQGDQARAAALAQEFLAQHPGSPHAERVTAAAASAKAAR
jgi:TolA-binding protein